MANGDTELVEFTHQGKSYSVTVPKGLSDSQAYEWATKNKPKFAALNLPSPGGKQERAAAADTPRPDIKGSLNILEAIRKSNVPGLHGESADVMKRKSQISPYTKAGADVAKTSADYNAYEKESGSTIGATSGAMAMGPYLGATKGLPWIIQQIAKAGTLGVGAGGGAWVGGASPKEALSTAMGTTAMTPAFEALGAVPGAAWTGFKRLVGKELSPAAEARLPMTATDQPATANTPKEVLTHASKIGVKMTPGQATGEPVARYAQAIGERSIVGANKLASQMEENAGKFVMSTREFADRLDPKAMGLSDEMAGESIRQSTETAKSVTHENASDAYKQLKWANETPIETDPITKSWMKMRGSLPMGAEEQILKMVPRDQLALVDELMKPSGMKPPMTFEQGIQLRSIFQELGDADALPDRAQGVFRQMAKTVDDVMESSAKKAGFEKEWRGANSGWKEYHELYGDKQSPLYKILKTKDPAQITRQLMNRASARDVEILQQQNMTGALEALKRRVISDIGMQKFRVTSEGLGGYSESFLRKLFGPDTKELYLKADIGRRFRWQENPSGTSNVLLATEQFEKPSLMATPWGAAKFSAPRDPLSFLSQGLRTRYMPKALPAVPGAISRQE